MYSTRNSVAFWEPLSTTKGGAGPKKSAVVAVDKKASTASEKKGREVAPPQRSDKIEKCQANDDMLMRHKDVPVFDNVFVEV